MIDKRLQKIQKIAERFSYNGAVDKTTLQKINHLVQSAKLEEITKKSITNKKDLELAIS